MALRLVATVVLCAVLNSCAHQGVIVDKTARDYPFSLSTGVGGSFAFMLKDSTGAIHRQLVTPDVYARYEVGEYFNDLQPAPIRQQQQQRSDGKTMLTAMKRTPAKARQLASTQKTSRARKIASQAKARKSERKVAAAKRAVTPTARKSAPARKIQPAKLAQAATPRDEAEIVYISVVRCR